MDHASSTEVRESESPEVPVALPSAPPTSADVPVEELEVREATRGYRALAKGVLVSSLLCFVYVMMRGDAPPPRAGVAVAASASATAGEQEIVSVPMLHIPPARK
jgi:hypothetical protein